MTVGSADMRLRLGVDGALPLIAEYARDERTERDEWVEDGWVDVVRGRRGVEGPATVLSSSPAAWVALEARRDDARGVAVGKGLRGEENFCLFDGVASASNSSSSSSAIGPNATLRL